jgi:pentatricopeptide repeat protein
MRCFWSTTANVLNRIAAGTRTKSTIKQLLKVHPQYSPLPTHSLCRLYSDHTCARPAEPRPTYNTIALPALELGVPDPDTLNLVPEPPTLEGAPSVSSPSLTTAQVSRAAAQTVRVCLGNGHTRDAFYVVNSLLDSKYHGVPFEKRPASSRRRRRHLNTIDFGRTVPARLAAHALLHGLLRQGLTTKAAKEAQKMMEDGMKIQRKTLEACILNLSPTEVRSQMLSRSPVLFPKKPLPLPAADGAHQSVGPQVLHLRGSLVSDPYTRFGVRLVLEARRQGYKRTKRSYHIAALLALVQGELLVATLIYITAARDNNANDGLPPEESQELSSSQSGRSRFTKERERLASRPLMQSMATTMKATLALPRTHDGKNEPSYDVAFQALANLTSLMDEHLIPSADLAPLISALYAVPYDPHAKVWIRRPDGHERHVYACRYFDNVLNRFIDCLLAERRSVDSHHTKQGKNGGESGEKVGRNAVTARPIGAISLRAYNALIHYALRHRFSPALASALLEHMSVHRSPPIEADVTTFNTIIRASTLARRNDFSDSILRILRERDDHSNSDISITPTPESGKVYGPPPVMQNPLPLSNAVKRYHSEDLVIKYLVSYAQSHQGGKRLRTDVYTLTTYIAHLVATGHANVVGDVLFQVLPELSVVNHPDWGNLVTHNERRWMRRMNRRDAIRRAAELGPWFFTAVLNALCKTGRTGLAERVWRLAKDAERMSWLEASTGTSTAASENSRVKPWCLPVHAYTIMLQCYANEATRGLMIRVTNKEKAERLIMEVERHAAGLAFNATDMQAHKGYAAWMQASAAMVRRRQNTDDDPLRTGRRLGYMLFKQMRRAGKSIVHSLKELNSATAIDIGRHMPHANVPVPDARFFNAALELFTRQPGMYRRRSRTPRSHWRQKLRWARRWYVKHGVISASSRFSVELDEVAREMVRWGYTVPMALRPMFVGRWDAAIRGANKSAREMRELGRSKMARPKVYPPVRSHKLSFRAHRVKTWKSRGLPLGQQRKLRPRGQKERTYDAMQN